METPIPKAEERVAVERAVLFDLSSVLENAPYLLTPEGLDNLSLGNTGSNCIHSHANRDGTLYLGSGISLGQSGSSTHSGCQSAHVNRDRIEYFRPGQGMSPSSSNPSGMPGMYHADMHDASREFGRHH